MEHDLTIKLFNSQTLESTKQGVAMEKSTQICIGLDVRQLFWDKKISQM